ncbi:MAG: flagellar biosynthesis protein FlhA [Oscillospiraceae bacterium]|nr:flagellar biosynthesis protein FlhA [Oscillospiraceae bacterium]
MKSLNNLVSVFVVAIIFLLIIPLPTWMLDLMFILNLAISFVILLTSLHIKEPLEFSIFPSVLLITTLFRIGLNVSSTRKILTNHGDAGQVIKTFGEFVIQNNVVVGFVIFIIIVLVQFIVITKGSERVAEVSARFTLDAMPGKQMAIDADLSSGLIDEQQAKDRRLKIQREADFFGSMDGASKFVKGDAILSIVVTFVNLLGGIIVGFINGDGTFMEIINIYATSTVGDGLMSQIPSLLISVATGMVVTHSSSDASLNDDMAKQFLSQPRVLMLAACAMACLCMIPGFPVPQVITISVGLFALGVVFQSRLKKAAKEGQEPELSTTEEITSEAEFYKNVENVYGLLNVEQIEMEFGYSLIPLVDQNSGGIFIDRVIMFRKQFAIDMGMVVPSVRLKDSGQLNPNQYAIKIKGEEVARGDILIDHYLALIPAINDDSIDGIDTVDPAFGIPAKWISDDQKVKAEMAGYTLIDPTSVIITHLSEVIKKYAYELLNRQEVNNMLANLSKHNETIVKDTIPSLVSVGDLQKVLSNLLREGVPIRDLETILETMADYSSGIKDIDMLTEYVRRSLKRTISHRFAEAGQLKVVSLDANLENIIMASVKRSDSGSYLALDTKTIQSIVASVNKEMSKVKDLVQTPIVLTSPVVRVYFKKLVDQFYPDAVVLSFNEVDENIQIQSLGIIALNR